MLHISKLLMGWQHKHYYFPLPFYVFITLCQINAFCACSSRAPFWIWIFSKLISTSTSLQLEIIGSKNRPKCDYNDVKSGQLSRCVPPQYLRHISKHLVWKFDRCVWGWSSDATAAVSAQPISVELAVRRSRMTRTGGSVSRHELQ